MFKSIISISLLCFVAITLAMMLWPQSTTAESEDPQGLAGNTAEDTIQSDDDGSAESSFMAYYFHGAQRCYSCNLMESTAQETYAGFIKSGELSFSAINIGRHENKHFIERFELHMPTIGLMEVRNGQVIRSALLNECWGYLRNPAELSEYFMNSWQRFRAGEDLNS